MRMEETTKKAKSPAKSRKNARQKDTFVAATMNRPSHEEIAQLARELWAQRGYKDGYAEQDWLRAEQELQRRQTVVGFPT